MPPTISARPVIGSPVPAKTGAILDDGNSLCGTACGLTSFAVERVTGGVGNPVRRLMRGGVPDIA